MSFWFKGGSAGNRSVIDKNTDYDIQISTTNNRVQFLWSAWDTSGVWRTPNDTITSFDRWNHLVVTYDAGSVDNDPEFYLNGVFVPGTIENTAPVAPKTGAGLSSLRIGNANNLLNAWGGELDDVRIYNRILSDAEIAQLYQMGAPVGQTTSLPQGCPNIGDVCDDGTVYAGLSPDGNLEMFTTTIEFEERLPFNNGNSADFVLTNTTGNTGEANTNTLVVLDSDSATAGFQPHQAAQYCYDLVAYGADDWYLPSTAEYDLLLPAIHTLGDYTTATTIPDYHTSNEQDLDDISKRRLFTSTGATGSGSYPKEGIGYVRCARKGPAPRCANPYGLEGQMIYNTTHSIVQYCDGARWIGLGKDN